MKQHKWHKEIKAWADGVDIEFKVNGEGDWTLLKGTPYWECKNDLFRIKPQPKEPQYLYVFATQLNQIILRQYPTFFNNGEEIIGKIKLEVEE